ncbi:MAG: DUF3533 domain-containing protein [Chloroflexi bacterium]|nr:DUF3533 domain-containing protein [Chloroflexota bacterium]OJV93024.1 MAG: hypothetical protein BGO39_21160 [Chloroflexi bacterium 54-19]
MFKHLLKDRLTWLALGVTVLLGSLITFSYLGAFLSPASNTRDLPLAVINADQGLELAGQKLNYGQQVVDRLMASQPNQSFRWTVLPSREAAVSELNKVNYYAALIIPPDYSGSLAALGSLKATRPIQLEVLTNQAAGPLADSAARGIIQAVVTNISTTTGDQLKQKLQASAAKVPAEVAGLLNDPVQARFVLSMPVGENSARGLSPFYFALMLILSGFVGTNLLSILVDSYTEKRRKLNKRLNVLDLGQQVDHYIEKQQNLIEPQLSALSVFYTKAALYGLMAVGVGLLDTWVAVGLLGMDAPDWVSLSLFAVFSMLTINFLALFFQTVFGYHLSLVIGLFFFTILGVPASGGPYSLEMVPGLWQFLHLWLPAGHITEGMRALLFMNGNLESGLGLALLVLGGYLLGSLVFGWLISFGLTRRNRLAANSARLSPVTTERVEQVKA